MRGIAGNLLGSRLCGRARAAAMALALASLVACGGGSGSDAAESLASVAAGASLVGELRFHGAVPAVYARQVLDGLRGEAAKAVEPLKQPDAGPGAASVLNDAERLDSALAAMRRAVDAGDAPRLQAWVVETNELAESLSSAAEAMKGGAGG